MTSVLGFEGLRKRYGPVTVLRDVTLDVAPGEFVVLIGGSGSGKTTLLRLAGGLERADGGSIHLRGTVVDEPASGRFIPPQRRRLGMVFQDYALWPHFTCLENVQAVVSGPMAERRVRATKLLERVGMATHAAARPHQLSGGQQQRVGLARALAAQPDVLLFDEALSSLDADIRERLRIEIAELARQHGTAALFVSHDPLDAWRLADRIVVLEQGRLTQTATSQALYARPATARAARFTGAVGGFVAELRGQGAEVGVVIGSRFWPVTPMGVEAGGRAAIYIRPEGVARCAEGIAARLKHAVFEAGQHRVYWLLIDSGATICSLEAAPPDAASTCLKIDRNHAFAYPEGDASYE